MRAVRRLSKKPWTGLARSSRPWAYIDPAEQPRLVGHPVQRIDPCAGRRYAGGRCRPPDRRERFWRRRPPDGNRLLFRHGIRSRPRPQLCRQEPPGTADPRKLARLDDRAADDPDQWTAAWALQGHRRSPALTCFPKWKFNTTLRRMSSANLTARIRRRRT